MTVTDRPRVRRQRPDVFDHRRKDLVTVRIWRLPVRIMHWTLAGTITLLCLTGFYIGTPYWTPLGNSLHLMSWVRAIHYTAGWVMFAVVCCRIIWMFLDNKYGRWTEFIPVTKQRRKLLVDTLAYYSFLRRPPKAPGHNPLAGLAYAFVFCMLIVQFITGAALQSLDHPRGWLWNLTYWVFDIFSTPMVRLIHHLVMYAVLLFVIQHLFSATLVDLEERNGEVSSMITGYKTLPRAELDEYGVEPDEATIEEALPVSDDTIGSTVSQPDVQIGEHR